MERSEITVYWTSPHNFKSGDGYWYEGGCAHLQSNLDHGTSNTPVGFYLDRESEKRLYVLPSSIEAFSEEVAVSPRL